MTPPKFTRIARTLRKHDTWAEKLMWTWLRDRRFSAYKCRRQHPYPPHTLDFFCIEAMVNIELDGNQHGTPEQRRKMQNAMPGSNRVESKCCGFGTPGCVARSKWFAMRFGRRFKSERHNQGRSIAGQ